MNADLRRLVLDQLLGDAQLGGMLAAYKGQPAVFYQKSPSDSRPGWGEPRYPRVDFNVDMRHDPERKTAGTMTFNIWCSTECPDLGGRDPDRAIEERLLDMISGTFYTGQDRATVCAEWERSDEFDYEGNQQNASMPEIYGLTVTFELMEFPEQITTSPDPIQGLNAWTKKHFKMTAIAHDEMPPIWKPTDENPAIYWRFEGAESTDQQSYSVTWYNGTFSAHILAESVRERNRWMKAIMERVQIDGEIILPDDSPMFIKRIAVRHGADPLREGQLGLTGRYGVLAQPVKEPAQIKLLHPYYSLAKEEKKMADNTAAYKASELAAQARTLFGTTPEVVTVALRSAGKETATVEEAKQTVQAFLDREVK